MPFMPKFTITPKIARVLGEVERARQAVADLPITAHMLASLRESARLASTHHSTAIEGNLLSAEEVRAVIAGDGGIPHREKDEKEVRDYYRALDYVERQARLSGPITEEQLKMIHGLAFLGQKRPSSYRTEQNVIRSGKLVVYIPPRAEDVPALMAELIAWINAQADELPVPILAGLAHYELATIHPYIDGNGRTARLLTTLVLHKHGYDLKGIYSLEEYYARNLRAYYDALTVGTDEDYHDGDRATSDLTGFVEYFVTGMADAFLSVQRQAEKAGGSGSPDQSQALRQLLPEQRQALRLFRGSAEVTVAELSIFFDMSDRQIRRWCGEWVSTGFLELVNPRGRPRRYRLAEPYEAMIARELSD